MLMAFLYATMLIVESGWHWLIVMGIFVGLVAYECWRRARLRPAGECPRCRYELTGLRRNPDGAIRCPECGNEDRFMIAANIMAEVTDDGAEMASPQYGNGFEWDEDSHCICPECDCAGPLKSFHYDAETISEEA